jgi:hypothetical protein
MPYADKEAYKAYQKAYREKNKEAIKEKRVEYNKVYNAAYYAANADTQRARAKQWRKENREHVNTQSKTYRDSNKETVAASRKKWAMNNQDKVIANVAKRHAAKLRRTPKWLTSEQRKQIEYVYLEAKMLEVETGIKHHVDHILPLQGKNVSGLHVPENLRVITALENHRKFNHYQPN